jgi:hypothetical protein
MRNCKIKRQSLELSFCLKVHTIKSVISACVWTVGIKNVQYHIDMIFKFNTN